MGDGKALQMGTSHELGQNFARAFDIGFTATDQSRQTGLDHVVGRQHPDGRRPDHGPRRRRRPAGAAPAGRHPGRGLRGQGRRGRGRRGPAARHRAALPPVSGPSWTTGSTRRSAVGPSTGSSRACRSGSRSGRATSPTARRPWSGGSPARKEHRCRWPRWLRRCRRCSSRTRTPCTRRPNSANSRPRSTSPPPAEALEAAATGWARLPWADLGAEGEARLAEQAVTVRCLVRPDGSLPDADDEPGVHGRRRAQLLTDPAVPRALR